MSEPTTTAVSRPARALVLAVWAAFFAWLWFSGESGRYLGPRTRWVVVFGAIALAGAVTAQVLTLWRAPRVGRPSTRELAGLMLLVSPILAVLIVPEPSLGALAASKKATHGAIALGSLAAPPPVPGREISFIDIHYASRSQSYANGAGISDGVGVRLTGFVTYTDDQPAGTHQLTRFYVSCCAADAVPYSATVEAQAEPPKADTWLYVQGELRQHGKTFVVVPKSVETRSEPDDPYLY